MRVAGKVAFNGAAGEQGSCWHMSWVRMLAPCLPASSYSIQGPALEVFQDIQARSGFSQPSLETPSQTCPEVPLHENSKAGQVDMKINHHKWHALNSFFFSLVSLTKGFSSVVTTRFT